MYKLYYCIKTIIIIETNIKIQKIKIFQNLSFYYASNIVLIVLIVLIIIYILNLH